VKKEKESVVKRMWWKVVNSLSGSGSCQIGKINGMKKFEKASGKRPGGKRRR